jgi:antirestriction protein ArdC
MQLIEQVNETIITALEQGKIPWRSDHGFPRDILSRRRFFGLNAILLMTTADRHEFTSSFWGTASEWDTLDGKVKEGPATQIVLVETMRPCQVWNLDQISGDFPISRRLLPTVDYAGVDRIIANTKADIRFTDEIVAEYYYPPKDYIKMCRKEHFAKGQAGIGAYYRSLLHEIGHWTEVRLNWYSDNSEERELRAEITSDFLAAELGIPNYPYEWRKNTHDHLDIWVKKMRKNPKWIADVAAAATNAVDFILGFTSRVEPRHQMVEDEAA